MSKVITYIELAAFFSSLMAWPVIKRSSYLRLFPLLLFVVISVEVYQTFLRPDGVHINALVYNVQVPLQHLLYLYILFLALDRRAFKKIMAVVTSVFFAFAIITAIFFTAPDRFNVLAYCIGSVCIITGILLKFYEMLQNPTDFNFLKKPFFYMLFAFLLFNVGTLPYFAMSNWLYFVQQYENMLQILISVMSVFNYVLYSTYTIAFLWMTLKKDFS
ncbi:MAG: hypothetical protein ACOYXT_04535 [Bacteroidota bacterium]